MEGSVVIGAHSAPDFVAHAWIEHHGMPLLPPEDFTESRLLEL
jgi:hypothetical protein